MKRRVLTRDEVLLNLGLSGIACSIAQSMVMPFETTMVRQQLASNAERQGFFASLRTIIRSEGSRSLYRGIEAAILREMSYSTLRFGLYEPFRNFMNDDDAANAAVAGPQWASAVRIMKRMVSGCTAGGIASAIASPTDLIKVRAMKDTQVPIPGLMHYIRAISGSPGGPILPFYEGVSATIARAVVLGATKMTVYNEVKDFLKRSATATDPIKRPASWQEIFPFLYGWKDSDYQNFGHSDGPSLPEQLLLVFNTSVVAGLAVTITTSPFTNARTHMMAYPGVYRGLPHALVSIGMTKGPQGYFRGFAAQWARFGPYATVQFVAWEQLRLLCGLPGI